jgi:DNA-binding response OmpR family regulator/anti-anti-sigma regulatory factor
VPKVLVSNNSELLRHFTAPPFARLGLEILVAKSADEARELFVKEEPSLVVLDAEPAESLDVARTIKHHNKATRVILVAGKRLSGDQMREISACGCDELLIAPMTADELHDVVAIQLGETRPGTEGFHTSIALGGRTIESTVSNLSIDGVRLVVAEQVSEGQIVEVTIVPDSSEGPVTIKGTAVWAQPRDGKTVVGIAFAALDERARAILAKLTQWQVQHQGERTRVVLRGDFTEATRFDELLPQMVGRVVFDTAQVTYMNSLGVRAWCEFLRQARIQGYEFHACSVPFILQASMVKDVVGRGTVTSFFAPFHCISCDHQEERLLQSAAILASGLEPPVFKCPSCGGALEFDDLPERYFAFLQDDSD